MNEIRGGRRVRKSFLKDSVDTSKEKKKERKCLPFLMLWLVRLELEPSLCWPTMYVYVY